MTARRRTWTIWGLFGLTLGEVALGIYATLAVRAESVPRPNLGGSVGDVFDVIGMGVVAIATALLGAVTTTARRDNPGTRLLLAIGITLPWYGTGNALADWGFYGSGPGNWLVIPAAYLSMGLFWSWALAGVFALRFPTGRLMSWRWRILEITGVASAAVITAAALVDPAFLTPDPQRDVLYFYSPGVRNPLGISVLADAAAGAFGLAILGLYLVLFGGIVSLVIRFLRSRGEERQQLKWLTYATVTTVVLLTIGAQLNRLGGVFAFLWENVLFGSLILIPVALGIALLKYRLYDIDVVINKTIVFAVLATFISAAFGVIVVLPFTVFDISSEDGGSLTLPLAATVVLVLLIQPARRRAQRAADRLVYGTRASPYEALSDFSSSLAGTVADSRLLRDIAEIMAKGTGAEATAVWLTDGEVIRAAAGWPSMRERTEVDAEDGPPNLLPGATHQAEVRHQDELLGILTLTKRAGDQLRPIERALVDDLASQTGIVLRNFRLTEELKKRVEQLRASRQRLVSAQDEERRKLERNLHDGAQQQLVALKIKLSIAMKIEDAARRSEMLTTLIDDTDDAIQALRDLARGIYPPLLEQEGLVAALRSQAAKAAIPVTVTGPDDSRYGRDIEAAVYFCSLEAIQNVVKYADAGRADVELSQKNGSLLVRISDDGLGFDATAVRRGSGLQNMEDRIEALGGHIEIASRPGEGTIITATVPLGAAGDAATA